MLAATLPVTTMTSGTRTIISSNFPKKTQDIETIPDKNDNSPTVKLNVGGTLFVTRRSTLAAVPGSLLATLEEEYCPWYQAPNDWYFFDRDPGLFTHILNVYRWRELHIPKHVCPAGFRRELEFWKIPVSLVQPCCLKTLCEADDEVAIMDAIKTTVSARRHSASVRDVRENVRTLPLSTRLWIFLDDPSSSLAAKIWFFFYQGVVLLSACIYLIWMIPSLRVPTYLSVEKRFNHTNDKIAIMMDTDPTIALFILDTACMVFFTTEFMLHFVVCPNKGLFLKQWFNLLNFVLVLVMISSFVLEIRKDLITSTQLGTLYYVLKNLNVFRLLMLVRLQNQYIALRILIASIVESRGELLLMAVAFFIAVLIYAGLIFCAEIHTTMFPDIWVSLWWAIITMTTVGYGDFYPTDLAGRIVATFCAITGLLLLALPIAVIATNFSEFYSRREYHKRMECMTSEKK